MRQQPSRLVRFRNGVSVIEALLVVVVVTATASTAIFKMSSSVAVDPARQSAQDLAENLRIAREVAIKMQAPVMLTLDQKSKPGRWVFNAASSANGPGTRWELPLDDQIEFDGTLTPIRLDAAGNASYFGEWRFHGLNGYCVRLEPMRARVTMKSIGSP